ncbi:protein involved in plasmid replication-relaxation [Amycolatopsis echigonensis]|uniref:Protein involved in plasmid replication-relaxation n=1 Tax=Amycolatopsis echigonensis TaxID=2576905 RepID=A0A2N3X125_9PSEU|nr:protein involved in plasmid replication-relaxation [Amycolatopsis niigatensis]
MASRSASGSAGARRSESADQNAEAAATNSAGQRWFRREQAEGRLRSGPHPSTHRGRAGRGGRRAGEPDAGLWFRLVDRDRRLLALLAEHKVLTTNQIAAIEFLSVRRAQDRLRHLRELGVVFAFRESYLRGGTSQTRYALGYLGARLIAAQRAEKPPSPKAYTESLERLALWPKLEHQLGVNDFFCSLAAHRNPARLREEGREGEVGGLTQWWSEKRCTEFFWRYLGAGRETRLRPDGYGCWEEAGRAVRFFLEHDTGTESLAKVTGKLDDYSDFPTDAFGVLLFSVHAPRREIALRTALHPWSPSRPATTSLVVAAVRALPSSSRVTVASSTPGMALVTWAHTCWSKTVKSSTLPNAAVRLSSAPVTSSSTCGHISSRARSMIASRRLPGAATPDYLGYPVRPPVTHEPWGASGAPAQSMPHDLREPVVTRLPGIKSRTR